MFLLARVSSKPNLGIPSIWTPMIEEAFIYFMFRRHNLYTN
jgi:hypothetical protein